LPETTPLGPEHARIWERLRDEDAEEILAMGFSPRAAVEYSIASIDAGLGFAFMHEGEPWAVMGIARGARAGTGIVGLFGTRLVDEHKVYFHRETRRILEMCRPRYELLENWVDARYGRSLRWLARIGFTVTPPGAFGPLGMEFCRVYIESKGRG
jgi:hypothetical protein